MVIINSYNFLLLFNLMMRSEKSLAILHLNNFKIRLRFIKNFFLCICKRIFIQIEYNYEVWTEISEYKKIKPTSIFKQCCSCKEYHDIKNLYLINRLNNKKYYYCKNCKSFTDWKTYMRKKHKISKV